MPVQGRILVVEDNEAERRLVVQALRLQGHTVSAAPDADRAMSYLHEGIDLVLCDVRLGSVSGIDLLGLWKKNCPRTQFILISGQTSVTDAVSAIKAGAYDYVTKPQSHDKLAVLIQHALEVKQLEASGSRHGGLHSSAFSDIVGNSPQMQQVFARIERAAPVDSTVLILGENGAGKELVAHALHENSPRRGGPFVAINVAAVPATLVESELFGHVRGAFTGATDRRVGRFEQADGGTLFIDEIGDFDLTLQPKLLRVLETLTVTPVGGHEDRRVNVRVIAATSRNIAEMVRQSAFREDLYYRLNVVRIQLPPLRDRPQDIPLLAEHFVRQIGLLNRGRGRHISPLLMQRLLAYPWPGNVRELHNTLESMMVLADAELLTEADLPDHIALHPGATSSAHATGLAAAADGHFPTLDDLEKSAIYKALADCSQNRTHAAHQLGISLRTLQRKLNTYQTAAAAVPDGKGDILTPS